MYNDFSKFPFWNQNTEIRNQKYMSLFQSDFSDPEGVWKLKLGTNDIYMTFWTYVQQIHRNLLFLPSFGAKIPKFIN